MKKTIKGLKVEIDQAKASDWHSFSLLRKASGASQFEQLAVLLELIEYITDVDEAKIVEHLGGDTAQASDVIALVSEIIQAATPKN